MKCKCECNNVTPEIVEHVKNLIGGGKLVEADGSYVLSPHATKSCPRPSQSSWRTACPSPP